MIIEFFGMPGAGKTTASQRITASEGIEVITITSKVELLWRNLLLIARHPIRSIKLFSVIVRNARSPYAFWYKFTNLFLHTNAKYQRAQSSGGGLIDQGYAQNVLSVFDDVQSPEALHAYLSDAFLPELLFVFEIPTELMSERLKDRHYIVRAEQGEDAFQNRLGVMEQNFQHFLQMLALPGVRMVRIDARSSPEGVHAMIQKALTINHLT